MHACASSGAFDCAKVLLAAGADPLAKNRAGKTPASCIDHDRGGSFAQELKAASAALREASRLRESICLDEELAPLAPRKPSTRI
jgi:ankyrin repeat protein